jgi:ribose 1,5-bisphosphokinase PhnN
MLGGGFPARSATMVIGPSGTGKTTLGLQFLAQSSAEEPGLLFGFYGLSPNLEAEGEDAHYEPFFRYKGRAQISRCVSGAGGRT